MLLIGIENNPQIRVIAKRNWQAAHIFLHRIFKIRFKKKQPVITKALLQFALLKLF